MTLNDYISLFSSHNRDKARLNAFASAVLQQVVDLQAIIPDIIAAYTPDSAVGVQLDTLAASIGLYRKDTTAGESASDEVFRDYIKKKLLLWTWDGTNATLPGITERLAANSVECDNQNGTVTITGAGTQPAALKKIYPITAGVRTA